MLEINSRLPTMFEAFLKNKIRQFDRRAKKHKPSMRMSGKGTKRLMAHIMKKTKS